MTDIKQLKVFTFQKHLIIDGNYICKSFDKLFGRRSSTSLRSNSLCATKMKTETRPAERNWAN